MSCVLSCLQDFSKLDILLRVEEACAGGDSQLQAAWEAAAAFKRRYMEQKAELDSIRLTAARMQVGAGGTLRNTCDSPDSNKLCDFLRYLLLVMVRCVV